MGIVKSGTNSRDRVKNIFHAERHLPLFGSFADGPQIFSKKKLHGDEILVVHTAEIVNLNNVFMMQEGRQLGFVYERGNQIILFREVRKDFFDGNQFFIKRMGITAATPLFIALIVIELTDILFALDSIPAILAITADPFLVFSSNIMAILGLRSMYFLISRMLAKFRYINYSLVVILAFVGIKMLISHYVHFPEWLSLSVIVLSLLGGVLASLFLPEKNKADE